MKKTILMTIVLVMILSIASVVNAATGTATLNGGVKEVKTNDTVTLTITTSDKVKTANFKVDFDKSFLQFVKLTVDEKGNTTENPDSTGINFNYISTAGTNTFVLTFKVIGTKGSDTVKVTPNAFYVSTSEKFDLTSIGSWTYTIKEEVAEQPGNNNTVTPQNNTVNNTNTANTNTANKNTTNTNVAKPDKLPQTGAVISYSAIATVGIVLILTVGAVAYYKMKK